MLAWLVDLRKTESPADEWISRGEKIRNDLQCEGTSFVDSIKEDLRKSLCTKDILDLTGDIDESKMQILIMLVSAILKIPPQLESISATLALCFVNRCCEGSVGSFLTFLRRYVGENQSLDSLN